MALPDMYNRNENELMGLLTDETRLTYKNALHEIAKITSATALIRVFYAGAGFTLSYSLSELGNAELAAAALITTGQLLIYNASVGAGRSSAIIITRLLKQGKVDDVVNYFHHGLVYSTISGLIATGLILSLPSFFRLCKQPHDVVDIAQAYLFPYAFGMLPRTLLTNLRDFSFANKHNIAPLSSAITEQVLIAAIGYCVATGKFCFKPYGAAGFGYTSTVVTAVSLVVYAAYCLKQYKIRDDRSLSAKCDQLIPHLKELAQLGMPIGVRIFLERAAVTYLTLLAGLKGKDYLLSQEIALQYMLFIIVPFYGVGRGMGILVRRYAENHQDCRRLSIVAHMIASIYATVIAITFILFATPLVNFFVNDSANDKSRVIKMAQEALIIISATAILDSNRSVSEGCLRGIEKTLYTMLANLITIWGIGAPLTYTLGFQTDLELNGIFIGRSVGILSGLILLVGNWVKQTQSAESNHSRYRLFCCCDNNNQNTSHVQHDTTGYNKK